MSQAALSSRGAAFSLRQRRARWRTTTRPAFAGKKPPAFYRPAPLGYPFGILCRRKPSMRRLGHLVRTRPRLVLAFAAGIAGYALLPAASGLQRLLLGWNITSWVYLLSLWLMMVRAQPERIRHIARQQDESAAMALTLISGAAVMSLVAILLELTSVKGLSGDAKLGHLVLSGVTLIGAWLLLPTIFALHYAHLFYGSRTDTPPLLFPDKPVMPNYWDFLYFSFTIGVASQTADVSVGSPTARRVVLGQSVLSFVFNTSILAMSINVAASLVS